ncbi:hypothetical protein [Microbacterium esteraromaticum]|uniref:hypothetical protein n=1 Tax=Microbacterium esteraromaticum TaxID=57043 RepID=UPI00195D205E|nr:hypothetical protein [Microbacterium esteraromaticum]MBM7465980.1 hypothetical protein [Microbacterium esteraromaticum]
MLTTLHTASPTAEEVAALLGGVRHLDDAIDTITQVRIELWRLVADSQWRSHAVEVLRASLLERVAALTEHCAAVESQRSACMAGIS